MTASGQTATELSAGRVWREIAAEDFGRLDARTYVRTAGGIFWCHEARLIGMIATATRGADVASLVPPFHSLLAHQTEAGEHAGTPDWGIDVVSDVRLARVTPSDATVLHAAYELFMPVVPVLARIVRRQVGILRNDWSAPYWAALNTAGQAPWDLAVFFDPAEAWSWLGIAPAIARDLEAFTASVPSVPDEVAALTTLLSRDLGIRLSEAARQLGMSVRSLQRALAMSGSTFVDLRRDLRLERALALLSQSDTKIDAIASAVGFTSTTHFTTWFRRLQGRPPSQLRDPD